MILLYDACPCGSAAKFKFCCYAKAKNKAISLDDLIKVFPLHRCIVGADFQECGKTMLLVARAMPHGKFILATYLIDLWYMGVKDVTFAFDIDERRLQEQIDSMVNEIKGIDFAYEDARSLALGSIKYAAALGVEPHADWQLAKILLEPERSYTEKFTFGCNGEPLYVDPEEEQAVAEGWR